MIVLLALLPTAHAVRPTEGGLYAFSSTDDVQIWDEPTGRVRVHYSASGPNVVKAGDADGDGVPDFAEDVGNTAADVLATYDAAGFRLPISEADMGYGPLGGSPALDFYLVDFGGDSDGYFGLDGCDIGEEHCSGYMAMENDFRGYGYPNLHEAIVVLTSHELFHGVQDAYQAGQPNWFAEGTAVWAEQFYQPGVEDFIWFGDSYLDDAGRSLDRPPTGPVPSFAYGTALFWEYLTERHDPTLINALLEQTEADAADTVADVDTVLSDNGDSLRDAWVGFADQNVATGRRAGATDSYPFAGQLSGITAAAEGPGIDDDNRFYPLAATYYRIDHAGGPLQFGIAEPAPDLAFVLRPVADGGSDGPVGDPVAEFAGDEVGEIAPDLPAGGYWLVGTYPVHASESTKRRFCLGDAAFVDTCFPPDTGDTDTDTETARGGCACDGTNGAGVWLSALIGAALVIRRQRAA